MIELIRSCESATRADLSNRDNDLLLRQPAAGVTLR
jgi:hypothetical protein